MKKKRQLSAFINKKICMENDCTHQSIYNWLVEFEQLNEENQHNKK